MKSVIVGPSFERPIDWKDTLEWSFYQDNSCILCHILILYSLIFKTIPVHFIIVSVEHKNCEQTLIITMTSAEQIIHVMWSSWRQDVISSRCEGIYIRSNCSVHSQACGFINRKSGLFYCHKDDDYDDNCVLSGIFILDSPLLIICFELLSRVCLIMSHHDLNIPLSHYFLFFFIFCLHLFLLFSTDILISSSVTHISVCKLPVKVLSHICF